MKNSLRKKVLQLIQKHNLNTLSFELIYDKINTYADGEYWITAEFQLTDYFKLMYEIDRIKLSCRPNTSTVYHEILLFDDGNRANKFSGLKMQEYHELMKPIIDDIARLNKKTFSIRQFAHYNVRRR